MLMIIMYQSENKMQFLLCVFNSLSHSPTFEQLQLLLSHLFFLYPARSRYAILHAHHEEPKIYFIAVKGMCVTRRTTQASEIVAIRRFL